MEKTIRVSAEFDEQYALLQKDIKERNEENCKEEVYSKRAGDWKWFSEIMINHIDNYTVPQYGDRPDDEVADWTPEACVFAIRKYLSRFGKQSRRGEQQLDLLKMAHFTQILYDKVGEDINV